MTSSSGRCSLFLRRDEEEAVQVDGLNRDLRREEDSAGADVYGDETTALDMIGVLFYDDLA